MTASWRPGSTISPACRSERSVCQMPDKLLCTSQQALEKSFRPQILTFKTTFLSPNYIFDMGGGRVGEQDRY